MKARCKNCEDVVTPKYQGGTDVTPCRCHKKSDAIIEKCIAECKKHSTQVEIGSCNTVLTISEHALACALAKYYSTGFYLKHNGWGGKTGDIEWLDGDSE